ncbi:MAG: alkaline phosphatase D family protein [Phototrophicaceae bacterium]
MSQPISNAEQIFAYIQAEVKRTFHIELTRRDFIKVMSGGVLGAIATSINAYSTQAQDNSAQASTPTLPNGIAVGDIDQTSAILWTHSTLLGTVTFTVSDMNGTPISTQAATVTDHMQPVKVFIEGLDPATRYQYQVSNADSTLIGQFSTFAESGTSGLRFGVSGDWRGELRPYVAIANIPERDLDFFVALGDTIYADYPSIDFRGEQARSLDAFRIKHNEVYSERFGKNYWAHIRANTPIFAAIDDHELTNDFAGGAPPASSRLFDAQPDEDVAYINQTQIYQQSMQVFHEYNPIRELHYTGTDDPRMENRPKIYRYRTIGEDAAFFILDARSFRDAAVDSMTNFLSGNAVEQWREDVWQAGRTMLGQTQINTLKRDLLDAQERGIIWKFIMMPEPVQQMGWFTGEDRWEGYAPERTEVLRFIEDNGIRNVVFVSADIHSTFISNISYQDSLNSELIKTSMWEISTGSIGFYPPTGQAAIELIGNLGVLLPREAEQYINGDLQAKDDVLESVFNRFVIATQGLHPLGLENSAIDYELVTGGWAIGHSFGWTEFDIAADTHHLTVTTYGVPSYSADDISRNPQTYLNTPPQILGQMIIRPILA